MKAAIVIAVAILLLVLSVSLIAEIRNGTALELERAELRRREAELEQLLEDIAARHAGDIEAWRELEAGYHRQLAERDEEMFEERRRWAGRVRELESRLREVPVEPSDLAAETTDLLQAYRPGALIEPMALRLFRASRSAVEAAREAALSHGGAEEQVAHLGALLRLSEQRCQTLLERGDDAAAAAEGCSVAFAAYRRTRNQERQLWEAERELLERQARRQGWRRLLWGFGGGLLVGLAQGGG